MRHHELKKVTFDDRWSYEFYERLFSLENGCTLHHVACFKSIYTKTACTSVQTVSQWVSKLSFTFDCAKSQNLARLREIAKVNTRKIVGIPKSQNFVLANNSNNKVVKSSPKFILLKKKTRSASETEGSTVDSISYVRNFEQLSTQARLR